jgi:hypothetical protein
VFASNAGAQVELFSYAPPDPLTGDTITFTALVPGNITWDLDGDGSCGDASGPTATAVFNTSGAHAVRICVDVDQTISRQDIIVRNRPPVASFTVGPTAPVARELVTLTSSAVDVDGPIILQQWDLDGDGVYDDATGERALYFWRRAGTYQVGLSVTDRDGAVAISRAAVVVAPALLTPTPRIRFVGVPTRNGAHLDLLTVVAPKGAHVGIRCKGRGCPFKHKRYTSKGERVKLRRLARSFPAGTVIEIRVTSPGTIGTFTRIRIRAGKRPARLDRCLEPGKPNKLVSCST